MDLRYRQKTDSQFLSNAVIGNGVTVARAQCSDHQNMCCNMAKLVDPNCAPKERPCEPNYPGICILH